MQIRTISKNQILTLKLKRQGLTRTEICEATGIKPKSVDEAIKRGKGNIQRAIDIIQLAIENDILVEEEKSVLRTLLGKI
jgi:hypothetical protein